MTQFFRTWAWPILAGLLAGALLVMSTRDRGPGTNAISSFAPAAQAAAPSVVNIYTANSVRRRMLFNEQLRNRILGQSTNSARYYSLGSGVIVRADGYIVTSNHVIQDADEIQILYADGDSSFAEVIGTDPDTDLAVLRVNRKNLAAIRFGDAHDIAVGDIVLAIGNPYGFSQTVTQGIVSATGRYGLNLTTYEDYIQTDAAINPGSSGGALVDMQGRLLGINSAFSSPSQGAAGNNTGRGSIGIGLATPADTVMMVVEQIIENGRVIRGYLGIQVSQTTDGIIITGVWQDSPAEQAGLARGDLLLEVNNQRSLDARRIMYEMAKIAPGTQINIKIERAGVELDLPVTIGLR